MFVVVVVIWQCFGCLGLSFFIRCVPFFFLLCKQHSLHNLQLLINCFSLSLSLSLSLLVLCCVVLCLFARFQYSRNVSGAGVRYDDNSGLCRREDGRKRKKRGKAGCWCGVGVGVGVVW